MKRTLLAAPALAALAFATLGSALPASAATPQAFGTDKPTFYYAGGQATNFDETEGSTTDRTPGFTLGVDDADQRGMLLTVRLADGGPVLCEGTAPVDATDTVGCRESAVRLAQGVTEIEASLVSPDGTIVSDVASLTLYVSPAKPTLTVTSYDAASNSLLVEGSGQPGARVAVGQRDIDSRQFTISPSGKWTATLPNFAAADAITATQTTGSDASRASAYFDPERPAPAVTATVRDRHALIAVGGGDWDVVQIRGENDTQLAGGRRTGDQTTLSVPVPRFATTFTVITASSDGDARAVSQTVTVNADSTEASLESPVVSSVQMASSRAVVSVSGIPGAAVSVVDSSQKVLALRIIGPSGVATVPFSVAPSKASGDFVVTQSIDGVTSDAEDFRLPSN